MKEQPKIRFREHDLRRIAQEADVHLTTSMRRDWTGIGLLAPSTPEGRPGAAGRGVGRYWTAPQVQVFEAVLDRYRGCKPRQRLANLPVAFWLLRPDGDEYVPLLQVRRALATFASAAWTRKRIEDVAKRRVLSAPVYVKALPELVKRVEALLERDLAAMPADAAALPKWLTTLPRDTLPCIVSQTGDPPRPIERQSAAQIAAEAEAGRRGLAIYTEASADAYTAARQRYREWAFYYPRELAEQAGDLHHRWKELRDNACADLLIALGEVASG